MHFLAGYETFWIGVAGDYLAFNISRKAGRGSSKNFGELVRLRFGCGDRRAERLDDYHAVRWLD